MKRILIIGAGSFIGRFFLDNSKGYDVKEFDIESSSYEQICFDNIDVVFHVAAIVHQDKNISDELYFSVNRDLAFNAAQAAKKAGVSHFIFMSTVKVYGENSTLDHPWNELTACSPLDAYGKSKFEAEKLLSDLNDDHFIVSIIRTPLVYGSGVKGNVKKIANLVKSFPIIPLGRIDNTRSMVYVGNLIALVKRVIDLQYVGVVLANDSRNVGTSDFVKFLIKGNGKKRLLLPFPSLLRWLIKHFKPELYHRLFGSLVVDSSITFDKINFDPPYAMSEGFKEVMK